MQGSFQILAEKLCETKKKSPKQQQKNQPHSKKKPNKPPRIFMVEDSGGLKTIS